jgi:hypothetical protein
MKYTRCNIVDDISKKQHGFVVTTQSKNYVDDISKKQHNFVATTQSKYVQIKVKRRLRENNLLEI